MERRAQGQPLEVADVDFRRVDLGHGKSCWILGLTQVRTDHDHKRSIPSRSVFG